MFGAQEVRVNAAGAGREGGSGSRMSQEEHHSNSSEKPWECNCNESYESESNEMC